MKKIKIGTKSTCRMCGKEIEYIGPYWRHTTTSPRHPATPPNKAVAADPNSPIDSEESVRKETE